MYLFLFVLIILGLNCFIVNEEQYISIIVCLFFISVFYILKNIILKFLNNFMDFEKNYLHLSLILIKTINMQNSYFFFEFPLYLYLNTIYYEYLLYLILKQFEDQKIYYFTYLFHYYNLYLIKFYIFEFKKFYLHTLTIRRFKIHESVQMYYYSLVLVAENYNQNNKFFQFLFDNISYTFLKKQNSKFNDFFFLYFFLPFEDLGQLKIITKLSLLINNLVKDKIEKTKIYKVFLKNLKLLKKLYIHQNKINFFIIQRYLYYFFFIIFLCYSNIYF